jgi:hypothetical protein
MRKFSSLSKVTAAAVLGSVILTGCGAFGSGDAAPLTQTGGSTGTVSGVAVKGYLEGSTVWIDLNNDGVKDANETTVTDANGSYELNATITTPISIQVSGGVDADSGEGFTGVLKAPLEVGATEPVPITPVTTIIAAIVDSGETLANAKAQTASSLGIANVADLIKDPIVEAKAGNTAMLKQSLKVARLIQYITTSSTNTNFNNVAAAVAASVKDGSNLDTAVTAVAAANSVNSTGITNLSNALDEINLDDTTGTTIADLIKSVETATSVVMKMIVAAPTKVIKMQNVVSVVASIKSTATATQVINIDTLSSNLSAVDLNTTTGFDAASVAADTNATIEKSSYVTEQKEAVATPTLSIAGKTLTIGDETITLGTNATFTKDVNTSGDMINNFFNVALSDINISKSFATQDVNLSVSVVDTDNAGDKIELSINGVKLDGNATNHSIMIPAGSSVTLMASNLPTLTYNNSTVTKTIENNITNTDLNVSVSTLLANISGTDLETKIAELNTYLATPNTYTVTLSIDGIDANELAIDYKTITGTITVE